jgi:uncharacterized protein YndB with AHSA1/START domain
MPDPTYAYVIYVLTTPQQVWDALTDAEISLRYWEHANVSDWKVGSGWKHQLPGKSPDIVGEVLESDPPHRLVVTWAAPADVGNPDKVSEVTFEIDDLDGKVRLKVTHTKLDPHAFTDASGAGWPAVLSNLKSLLETGRTIPNPFGAMSKRPGR